MQRLWAAASPATLIGGVPVERKGLDAEAFGLQAAPVRRHRRARPFEAPRQPGDTDARGLHLYLSQRR